MSEIDEALAWADRRDGNGVSGFSKDLAKAYRSEKSAREKAESELKNWKDCEYESQVRALESDLEQSKLELALKKCLEGFEYSRQYVGYKMLPAIKGWTWYDADCQAREALGIPQPDRKHETAKPAPLVHDQSTCGQAPTVAKGETK